MGRIIRTAALGAAVVIGFTSALVNGGTAIAHSIGRAGVGYYDARDATFHLRNSLSAGSSDYAFVSGSPADADFNMPVAGDWDGDGRDSVGYYHSDGNGNDTFHLRDSLSAGPSDYSFALGPPSYGNIMPVAGDWNGDGNDTVGYLDRVDCSFHLRDSLGNGSSDYSFYFRECTGYGAPVAGDWDGDGRDSVGFFDVGASRFHLRNSLSEGPDDYSFQLGSPADANSYTPVAGDWDGDGRDSVGFYNAADATFHLRNALSAGPGNYTFRLGVVDPTEITPVAGDWNGQ